MYEDLSSARRGSERRERAGSRTDRAAGVDPRPDRFAFWAVCLALIAMLAGAASADGANGGIGAVGGGDDGADETRQVNKRKKVHAKYAPIYNAFKVKEKRWARRTSKCESGHNPRAVSPGKKKRDRHWGAFQFKLSTWRTAPKSPGGNPIRFTWKTQAVVAVLLHRKAKRKGWPNPWPNCG